MLLPTTNNNNSRRRARNESRLMKKVSAVVSQQNKTKTCVDAVFAIGPGPDKGKDLLLCFVEWFGWLLGETPFYGGPKIASVDRDISSSLNDQKNAFEINQKCLKKRRSHACIGVL